MFVFASIQCHAALCVVRHAVAEGHASSGYMTLGGMVGEVENVSFARSFWDPVQTLPSAPHLSLFHRGAFLLTDVRVQEQVGLDVVQRKTIGDVMAWLGGKQLAALHTTTPNEEQVKNLDRQASDQILKELSAAQRERLEQVTIHAAGIPALVEPEVVKMLRLSPEQVAKIHRTLDAADKPRQDLEIIVGRRMAEDPKNATAIDRSYRSERVHLAKQEAAEQEKSLDFLTEAQVKQWRAMGG